MPVLFEAPAESQSKKTVKKEIEEMARGYMQSRVFSTYLLHPSDIRFETQGIDEEVLLFLRQHLIVFVPQLMLGLVFFFIPIGVFPFLFRFIGGLSSLPAGYIMVGMIFWYEALFGYLLASFIHWYFNIFIVTNKRIIDIDFLFLLYKKFSETKLDKVQDISFKTGGIMATMFNYGDVIIQTAGELPNFVFEKVPRPSEVVRIISELTSVRRGRKSV